MAGVGERYMPLVPADEGFTGLTRECFIYRPLKAV
jgi:hypothetical protein